MFLQLLLALSVGLNDGTGGPVTAPTPLSSRCVHSSTALLTLGVRRG